MSKPYDCLLGADVLSVTGFFGRGEGRDNRAIPIAPLAAALTASTEASMTTGVYPDVHAVQGNAFRERRDGRLEARHGFGPDAVRAELLVKAAAR